jgi:hypothetical protein
LKTTHPGGARSLFRQFTLLAIAGTSLVTIYLVSLLKPTSATAFALFSMWLLAPNGLMVLGLGWGARKQKSHPIWDGAALLVTLGGVVLVADPIFWHRDAQSAIAIMMTPLTQAAAGVLLAPVCWWVSRRSGRL